MSILHLRKHSRRPAAQYAPRHHAELSPAEAARFANGLNGKPDTEDGTDVVDALRALDDEPRDFTAAQPFSGSQDPAMEVHHEAAEAVTESWSTVRPRVYLPQHAAPCLLPAIELDREIRLWVRTRIASGAYEDIDAFADRAERRVQSRSDDAHRRISAVLSAGWRQISAIAAAGRAA